MALTPIKFSALPAMTTLDGTEEFPGVQVGANGKATAEQIKDYTMGFAASKTGDTLTGVYTFKAAAFTPQPAPVGTNLYLTSEDVATRISLDSHVGSSGGPQFFFRKSRGTASTPSALASSDQLLHIAVFGYGATAYSPTSRGGIIIRASETFTDSANGTYLTISSTLTGTTTNKEHLRTSNGHVIVGNDGSVDLQMGGANTVIDTNRLFNLRSYTVATLPTPGTAGRMAWASDCRVFDGAGTQEGAGVGTGGLVTDNGTNWKIAGTNVTAVA